MDMRGRSEVKTSWIEWNEAPGCTRKKAIVFQVGSSCRGGGGGRERERRRETFSW